MRTINNYLQKIILTIFIAASSNAQEIKPEIGISLSDNSETLLEINPIFEEARQIVFEKITILHELGTYGYKGTIGLSDDIKSPLYALASTARFSGLNFWFFFQRDVKKDPAVPNMEKIEFLDKPCASGSDACYVHELHTVRIANKLKSSGLKEATHLLLLVGAMVFTENPSFSQRIANEITALKFDRKALEYLINAKGPEGYGYEIFVKYLKKAEGPSGIIMAADGNICKKQKWTENEVAFKNVNCDKLRFVAYTADQKIIYHNVEGIIGLAANNICFSYGFNSMKSFTLKSGIDFYKSPEALFPSQTQNWELVFINTYVPTTTEWGTRHTTYGHFKDGQVFEDIICQNK